MLAVASYGGHWKQLRRITENFSVKGDIFYCTTKKLPGAYGKVFSVCDSNFDTKARLCITAFQMLFLVARVRPKVIITTGAAPGLLAIFFGWVFRVEKRVWVDSIANAEELSLAGKVAGRFATHWYTQWEKLSGDGVSKPAYIGRVL